MDYGSLIALGSLTVAILATVMGYHRNVKKEVKDAQRVSDKLDYIGATVTETKLEVQKINATLSRHETEIIKLTAKVDELSNRLAKVEGICVNGQKQQ